MEESNLRRLFADGGGGEGHRILSKSRSPYKKRKNETMTDTPNGPDDSEYGRTARQRDYSGSIENTRKKSKKKMKIVMSSTEKIVCRR